MVTANLYPWTCGLFDDQRQDFSVLYTQQALNYEMSETQTEQTTPWHIFAKFATEEAVSRPLYESDENYEEDCDSLMGFLEENNNEGVSESFVKFKTFEEGTTKEASRLRAECGVNMCVLLNELNETSESSEHFETCATLESLEGKINEASGSCRISSTTEEETNQDVSERFGKLGIAKIEGGILKLHRECNFNAEICQEKTEVSESCAEREITEEEINDLFEKPESCKEENPNGLSEPRSHCSDVEIYKETINKKDSVPCVTFGIPKEERKKEVFECCVKREVKRESHRKKMKRRIFKLFTRAKTDRAWHMPAMLGFSTTVCPACKSQTAPCSPPPPTCSSTPRVVLPGSVSQLPPPSPCQVSPSVPLEFVLPLVAPGRAPPPMDGPEMELEHLRATVRALRLSGWYYEGLTFDKSHELLKNTKVGTFLVRDSADPRFLFSLSVQTDRGPKSVRLTYVNGHFRLDAQQHLQSRMPTFPGVLELLQHYARRRRDAQVWVDPQGKCLSSIVLHRPLRKEGNPPSLKHLARLEINRQLKEPSILKLLKLELPASLTAYLAEYPYSL